MVSHFFIKTKRHNNIHTTNTNTNKKKTNSVITKGHFIPKNEHDLLKLRIQKLVENPNCIKEEMIENELEKEFDISPNNVEHVTGSIAGANSAEFYIDRKIRLKEHQRLSNMKSEAIKSIQELEKIEKSENIIKKLEQERKIKQMKRNRRKECKKRTKNNNTLFNDNI